MSGRASCRRCRRCRCRQPQHVPVRVPPHRLATFCERGAGRDTRKEKVPGCGLAPTGGAGHDVRSGQQPFLPGVHATSQRVRGEL